MADNQEDGTNMADNQENDVPEAAAAAAAASLPDPSEEEWDSTLLPDPDVDFPDLDHASNTSSHDPTVIVKPGKKEGLEKGGKGSLTEGVPQYILGTLVVRVVAARDLEPVQKGGFGQMVFGGGKRAARKNSGGGGRANSYASVKLGNSTQRSSEVYDSLDPVWPRQEAMFMDVSLPDGKVAHPDTTENHSNKSSSHTRNSFETTTTKSNSSETNTTEQSNHTSMGYQKPPTILTVALFHTPEIGRVNKLPFKGLLSGDSNDVFMGMASIDLQRLFTGRDHTFDGWLRLSGTETSRGSVRIFCEYEPSDPPPRPGDYCRFTRFCHPRDLYPLQCGRQYRIAHVDGDTVLISYTTPEGWVCTFQAHRFMLICEARHQSTVEVAQDEFASVAERFSHSPLMHSITGTVERVAVDGLLSVGEEVVHGGLGLFNRWLSGGMETVIADVTNVTNWDGRHNPNLVEGLDLPNLRSSDLEDDDGEGVNNNYATRMDDYNDDMDSKLPAVSQVALPSLEPEALPNMPACPITGFPMIDPVVAADGHTYERSAIARWLTTSNKSPMTGSVLPHKNLVTNYGLMSSVQEAAARAAKQPARKPDIPSKIEYDDSASAASSRAPSLETMETITVSSPALPHVAAPAAAAAAAAPSSEEASKEA